MPLPPLRSLVDPVILATRPEAEGYYLSHARRFQRVLELLREHVECSSCLDIGAGPETRLLAREYPGARIDTLGTFRDTLYAPDENTRHIDFDLSKCGDRSTWPPGRGEYDLVVCMEVLEHLLVAPQSVLAFLASRLRPAGTILLSTPNGASLRNRLRWLGGRSPYALPVPGDAEHGHLREYTSLELRQAIEAGGLAVEFHSIENLYEFSGAKNRVIAGLSGLLPASFRGVHVFLLRARA